MIAARHTKTHRVDPDQVRSLPTALRRLRIASGLTLKELGLRAGISTSSLSKIENGYFSPTYEKILTLADALGVEVTELFGSTEAPRSSGRRGVSRRGEGLRHSTDQYDYELLCSDLRQKQFLPIVTTIKAHTIDDFSDLLRHPGEEFIYVLEGTVTLHTDIYAPLELAPGDSCYFDSSMGHACVSAGREDARVLWVTSNTRLGMQANERPADVQR